MALLVAGGRYLVRPVLRFIARTDMREMFTALRCCWWWASR